MVRKRDDLSEDTAPIVDAPEPAQAPVEAPGPAVVSELPPIPDVPRITIDRFANELVAQHPAIARAFVSCEKRMNRTRKLTAAQWRQLYEDFVTAQR